MTTHYSEDDLTLYYYGEGRGRDAIERHVEECPACKALYREIAGTLAVTIAAIGWSRFSSTARIEPGA